MSKGDGGMTTLREWKRKTFPKGIKRELNKTYDRIFRRVTERKLAKAIGQLNIPAGAVIGVHSMLSGLGYIVGGAQTVIKAIQRAVPGCTIFMPTFPFSGSMQDYLDSNPPVFDASTTPSRSGLLTETLRLMPGAQRSFHPTHSCAALGPKADELLTGSEWSYTPFGDQSAYGRFCSAKDAYLLLIHTNNASIVHRIQEMADMPNLFFDEEKSVYGFGHHGEVREYRVKVHQPKTPLFVAVNIDDSTKPEFMWFPDYALLFPSHNKNRIINVVSEQAKVVLLNRYELFFEKKIYKNSKIHGAEIMSVEINGWMECIVKDVIEGIHKYNFDYALRKID